MVNNTLHPNTTAMLRAWRRITASPHDVDGGPSAHEYPGLLSRLFVIEASRNNFLPFRIAGNDLTEVLGRNLIGTNFLDLWVQADKSLVSALLESILQEDRPGIIRSIGQTSLGRCAEIEIAMAPLGHTSASSNRLLCLYQTLGGENMLQKRAIWSHKIRSIHPPDPIMEASSLRLVASND